MTPYFRFALLIGLLACACTQTLGATVTLSPSSDTFLRSLADAGGPFFASRTFDQQILESRTYNTNAMVTYLQFDLSSLNLSQITGATLRVWKVDATSVGGLNHLISSNRFAAYGLADTPELSFPNTPHNWSEGSLTEPGLDFTNAGAEWTNDSQFNDGLDPNRVVLLDPDQDAQLAITETVASDSGNAPVEVTLSGAALDAFLTSRVASPQSPGLATFMLTARAFNQGWGYASKEHSDVLLRPTLTITTAGMPGDYNNDQQVDARDYAVWRETMESSPGGSEAEHLSSNGNGLLGVDSGDFSLWRQHFGRQPASPPTTPTPEPGTLALLIAPLICLLSRGKR